MTDHSQRDALDTTTGGVDPITTEVIRHSLVSAAELMRLTLIRTAFSPIIYEVIDFCTAVYDRDVRLLAQGKSLPLWMGTLDICINASVDAVGGEESLLPGDVIVNTDAFVTGSHAQDMAILVPAFLGEDLVGYAAVKAHQMDLAAKHPYNMDTTDNFQEGVIYPGVRLYRGGELQEDVYRILIANSRLPENLQGDVNAVIAAARTGADALARIVSKHGHETFGAAVERMFAHGEAAVRAFLEQIPDGRYAGQGVLDNDGISDEPIPFEVAIEVAGSDAIVDFTGAPSETAGPLNCPLPNTISAARLAVVSIAGRHEAINEGHIRPIKVLTKEGTLFHPMPPAPIFLYFFPSMIAVDVLHRLLSDAVPSEVCAGSGGDLCGIITWRTVEGAMVATAADHPTGQGATAMGDGPPPMTHITCSGGRNTPVEVWETAFPSVMLDRMELVTDSGGIGKHRGGLGVRLDYRARHDIQAALAHERQKTPPWGLFGGGDGRPNAIQVRYPDGSTRAVYKMSDLHVPRGGVIEVNIGGGGGYGLPADRDPVAIHRDVSDGYVTVAAARRGYPHAFADEASDPNPDHTAGPSTQGEAHDA